MNKRLPLLSELSGIISYDRDTGVFRNLIHRSNSAPKGAITGTKTGLGYRVIRHDRQLYLAHRLAWLFITGNDPGDLDVDHIDGDPSNNSASNLRLATRAQNLYNTKTKSNNTSGHKGVVKARGKWAVRMRIDGKITHLATCANFDDAVAIYKKYEAAHRGEFARGNS